MPRVRSGPAEKLLTVHLILDGKETQSHAADRLGIRKALIQEWISIYKSDGEGAFPASMNKHYSKGTKGTVPSWTTSAGKILFWKSVNATESDHY